MSKIFKKFEIIKESINTFDDAEFVSIIDENTLLIKNTKTNEEFVANFKYDESTKTGCVGWWGHAIHRSQ